MRYANAFRTLLHRFGWQAAPRFAPYSANAARFRPDTAMVHASEQDPDGSDHRAAPLPSVRPTVGQMRRQVFAAFNPVQPVEDRSQLLGRSEELGQVMRAMLDMGMHALLYAARGAGKTSLVRAFGDHADERGYVVLYMSCGGGNSFDAIFAPYLADLPLDCFPLTERAAAKAAIAALPPGFGARALATVLTRIKERDVIFVLDEFDRVEDKETLGEIATLLKLMSDMRTRVQILCVGIADNVGALIAEHPSLRRHMQSVALRRFSADEADALLDHGERASGLRFHTDARATIATLAAGSPYHLRLFCFCAAMAAIDARSPTIGPDQVESGLQLAFEMWSSTNLSAAALFQKLADEGSPMRRQLSQIAHQSLLGDSLSMPTFVAGSATDDPHQAAAIAALRPVLLTSADGRSLYFDDTLAPQLLLATCYLADRADSHRPVELAIVGDIAS